MNKTRLSGFQIIIYGIDGDGARGRGVEGGWRGKGKSISQSMSGNDEFIPVSHNSFDKFLM